MNKNNIKELSSILEAYENSKTIQANYGNNQTMIDLPRLSMSDISSFIKGKCKLQIKSEPEYIPFTFEDAEQLIGKTIKSKSGNSIYIITAINYEYIGIWKNNINYDQLFDIYTFLDGSPCGKLKQ